MKYLNYTTLIFVILLFIISCSKKESIKNDLSLVENELDFSRNLEQIKKSGVLRAITTYSPTGYFLYRGQTMGFEYELLNKFVEQIGVRLEIVLAKDIDSLIPMLNNGDGDIISMGYTINSERKKHISFTKPYIITHQSLVQRKPLNWRKMSLDNINKSIVKDVVELIEDTVSVRKNTSFYDQLVNLSSGLGDTIYIDILPGYLTVEETIKLVDQGIIKYTISDNNIAEIHQSYYPNLDLNTPVSLSQRIGWAVRKNSPNLLKELNQKIMETKGSEYYNVVYNKYFKNRTKFNRILNSKYYTESTGVISKYDEIVKKYAIEMGWDWRLIKSMIFQESEFIAENEAWTGAKGLMQIMPLTAQELGVEDLSNPEENIKAGLTYLDQMYDYWKHIPDSVQRIKFALASYNSGYGHVIDAQNLAKKERKDSLIWDNGVDEYILKLSKSKYYNDPIVKSGYVRGSEPYNYVIEIFERFKNYKDFTKE